MEINLKPKEDEYLEKGVPYCKNCKTARYFIREDFIVPCKCKCQLEEIEKQHEQEQIEAEKRRLMELKEKSLLNKRYCECNFGMVEIINEDHLNIVNRLKKYCEGFKNNDTGIGVYLYGESGSGKTLLTACMIDGLISQGVECLFTNMVKIKQDLFSTDIRKQKTFFEKLSRVPVLFIDDFGTENVKKNGEDNFLQEIIYDIVNTRYNNMLPTIYTSNCSLKQCVEEKGILKKTIDRIYESTVQMKLDLPSYRLRKKENLYF